VREEGIAMPGYVDALAAAIAPYVEVARQRDLAEGPRVIDVEHEATVALDVRAADASPDAAAGSRALRFRADRLEEVDGARRFTDWKTGGPVVTARTPDSRISGHRRKLASGELLQAHAYALTGARARYVFLRPGLDDALCVLEAEPDAASRAAFEASVSTLLEARTSGVLIPRLRRSDRDEEPSACSSCDVKQACLRGDSGVRRRLGAWIGAIGDDATPTECVIRDWWQLAEARP